MSAELQTTIGYSFEDVRWLETAVTHKSFANEKTGEGETDNERLEFLGDAVLDLALSALLMRRFPADTEGALSKKRASLVNEETLSQIALELKLEEHLRLGKGEAKSGGLNKPRILASALEAVIGAVFSDRGYEASAAVVETLFAQRIEEISHADVDFELDYKTRLQERTQELHRATPSYKIERESGPDHDKIFDVSVSVGENQLGTGIGKSKKAAEQDAARKALEELK